LAAGPTFDERPPAGGPSATLFVSDPTAEAEQVARALRSSGYTVVDVPLSMLVARAAVQRPRVVLIDADSQGALEVVARMRELPQGEEIQILFVAAPGGVISSPEEALASEASGFFMRPVDLPALLREVAALTRGGGGVEPDAAYSTTPAPSISASASPKSPGSVPPSIAATLSPRTGSGSSPPSENPSAPSLPPTSVAWAAASRAVGLGPPVSMELQRLLAEAEQRAHVVGDDSSAPPSIDQEVEAVLPAELLAALDEPLDEDDGDPEPAAPTHPPARDRTSDGGAARTTGASGTGTGATPHGTGAGGTGADEDLLTPGPGLSGSSARPPARARPLPRNEAEDDARVDPEEAPNQPASMTVGPWQAIKRVAQAVASRKSGTLAFLSSDAERRIVFREGDVVTCASTADGESLLAFLGVRGDLPRETVRRLGSRFPAFGRHAGAALVARGYLRQDQMWTTLRAHAEWVLSRILQAPEARVVVEAQPQGRLAAEPSVFGGAPGAEVFVEVVRRVVAPSEAVERLGGPKSRLSHGGAARLIGECALAPLELDALRSAPGRSLGEVLDSTVDGDFATTIFALIELDILEVVRSTDFLGEENEEGAADVAALDSEAVRERVRARLQLVEDGDYFSILGVARDATGYDLRRAFLELRREFDPSRLLSVEVADLAEDVRTVTTVLEEAYEILKDPARRERYRRAIEGAP
jgi:CheY-like chemotaxis protein